MWVSTECTLSQIIGATMCLASIMIYSHIMRHVAMRSRICNESISVVLDSIHATRMHAVLRIVLLSELDLTMELV